MTTCSTRLVSHNEDETISIAEEFACDIIPGTEVILIGPLGSGKTAFVRGLARGLRCLDPVSSPSFITENLYRGPIPLLHIDLYRGAHGINDLSIDDARKAGAVVAVEWGDNLPAEFQNDAIRVSINIPDEDASPTLRIIEFSS